jgi:hypothetical protein
MSWANLWPFVTFALLGAYHGVNPGMGWLFAVARGLQEKQRSAVLRSLLPIALGHEASIISVVLVVGAAQAVVSPVLLRLTAALFLVCFAVYRLNRRMAHPRGFGMRVGPVRLAAWSFLMSSAHGAGLMLVPVVLGWRLAASQEAVLPVGSLLAGRALIAGTVHTAAMLLVMGVVALVVYEKVGVGMLRKSWFNLDLAWTVALLGAAAVTLITA